MARAGQIIFGSMRMHESGRSAADWADFLLQAHALGVRKIHSSDEYESFPLLCESLETLRKSNPDFRFDHIVKLADPSFDDAGFDVDRFSARLSKYRHALGAETIDDVQWMWRADLKDDAKRIADCTAQLDTMTEALAGLKREGHFSRLLCFAYSTPFAEALIDHRGIDGLTIYRNAKEAEYDGFLDRLADQGKSCIAIRPFAAGATLEGSSTSPKAQINAVLAHRAVEAAILSTSSLDHLSAILD